jgi:hypothetical protein
MWIEFAVLAVPEKYAIGQLLCFFRLLSTARLTSESQPPHLVSLRLAVPRILRPPFPQHGFSVHELN